MATDSAVVSTFATILIVQPPFIFGDPISGDAQSRAIDFTLCGISMLFESVECEFRGVHNPLIHTGA